MGGGDGDQLPEAQAKRVANCTLSNLLSTGDNNNTGIHNYLHSYLPDTP
jgi:hypothetical protein